MSRRKQTIDEQMRELNFEANRIVMFKTDYNNDASVAQNKEKLAHLNVAFAELAKRNKTALRNVMNVLDYSKFEPGNPIQIAREYLCKRIDEDIADNHMLVVYAHVILPPEVTKTKETQSELLGTCVPLFSEPIF